MMRFIPRVRITARDVIAFLLLAIVIPFTGMVAWMVANSEPPEGADLFVHRMLSAALALASAAGAIYAVWSVRPAPAQAADGSDDVAFLDEVDAAMAMAYEPNAVEALREHAPPPRHASVLAYRPEVLVRLIDPDEEWETDLTLSRTPCEKEMIDIDERGLFVTESVRHRATGRLSAVVIGHYYPNNLPNRFVTDADQD